MAAGKISIQANDGKVAGVVFEDGASSNVTVTIPKEGGVLATQDTLNNTISVPASYHIYNGQLALTNSVTTTGFSTTLYTGNGTTQSITTGVDMDTQWGNDASEKFGGLVWTKSRSVAGNNIIVTTVQGITKNLAVDSTNAEATNNTYVTNISSTGFTLGSAAQNNNAVTYASWNFQTTHRVSGVTNHGKAFTCHYNPFTGFTMVKYEGSGLAGHEIPHYLGRKLGFVAVKDLATAGSNWHATNEDGKYAYLNSTNATASATVVFETLKDTTTNLGISSGVNTSAVPYIMYGWANSYFDEKNTLIGNYEIGVYQGTGVAGNKVITRGKPAWVMVKRLDVADAWTIYDNQRGLGIGGVAKSLYANTSGVENSDVSLEMEFKSDSFVVGKNSTQTNASGGQYLYMVVYDNDSGSGKSKYPRATDTSTLNLNAHVPFANGIDTTGSKVSIAYKNEPITLSNSLVQGKNYIALLNDGSYVAKTIKPAYGLVNPASGDFFNLDTQKWYNNLNVEVTPRNYLDCVVYADQNGQPEYVEQIEKVQYFDAVKANDFRGKNSCTAWVNFDGTTTPPTIRDSYNIKSVVRTAAGTYDIYFESPMDNANYVCTGMARDLDDDYPGLGVFRKLSDTKTTSVFRINIYYTSSAYNSNEVNIQIFGGRN